MTPEQQQQRQELERRRRARNWALLLALIGLVALFYLISMARLTRAALAGG
jgi:fatty acid desaturase